MTTGECWRSSPISARSELEPNCRAFSTSPSPVSRGPSGGRPRHEVALGDEDRRAVWPGGLEPHPLLACTTFGPPAPYLPSNAGPPLGSQTDVALMSTGSGVSRSVSDLPLDGDRLLPLKQTIGHALDPPISLHVHIPVRHATLPRGIGRIVAIEEVVAGQVFKGRRTSLRAGSASQVFAGSRTASEDKDAGHRPGGSGRVGHAFKTGGRAKARRRVRFPSASAWRERGESVEMRRAARSLLAFVGFRFRSDTPAGASSS
jgi:hypothetical protein